MSDKIINVPEELVIKAKTVLGLDEAIQRVIRGLVDEIVKNYSETVRLWKEVQIEAEKQGIVKQDGDNFTFDHISEKFIFVKKEA